MTLATTISNVRRTIEEQPFEDTTSATTAIGAMSVTVSAATSWKKGDVMEFQDAGEQALCTADGSGTTVAIRKGHNGTTDASVASGTIIVKSPRFFYNQVSLSISEIVESLWPQVWVVTTTTITPSATADIYNLPADYEGFIDLMHQRNSTVTEIARPSHVAEVYNVPTAVLAAGKGLRVYGWHRTDTAATLTYKAQATTANMPGALERIVARGSGAKLLKGEAARYAGDATEAGQAKVRSALTVARFLEDEFAIQTRHYASTLSQEAGPVRRYQRLRVIGA